MSSVTDPNPGRVAASRLGTDTEEGGNPSPPADKGSTGSARGGARPGAGRPKKGGKAAPAPPKERSAEEVKQGAAVCAFLSATLWDVLGPVLKVKPLDDEEARKLGAALDPVLAKYLPAMGDWTLEINLALVVAALYSSHRMTPEEVTAAKLAKINAVPAGVQ